MFGTLKNIVVFYEYLLKFQFSSAELIFVHVKYHKYLPINILSWVDFFYLTAWFPRSIGFQVFRHKVVWARNDCEW